ncbi:MAG: DUF4844 domain-containing protein [Bacteroidetes bacterium]|nr:DUF4844 domain-containing protein [Bacteroidota bacterium]
MNEDVIKLLMEFIAKDKFADTIWNSRGLIPSDKSVSDKLQNFFNEVANKLVDALNSGNNPEQLTGILKSNLLSLNSIDYDTEEREFICEYIVQLSQITNSTVNEIVIEWMYGPEIAKLMKNAPGRPPQS